MSAADDADVWWARYHARSLRHLDEAAVRTARAMGWSGTSLARLLRQRDEAAVEALIRTLWALGYGGES